MSNTGGQNPESKATSIPREWNTFCAFIETHYRVIYTVALAHVRDTEVAQEITQDVCVRLLLEREKLPPMENASGWLVRVARNTAIDWVRRRQTHSRILAMMESWNHNPTAGNHTPADARSAAIMEEEKQRLYAALEHIAPEDREMLLMHYLDGVEKQDIARLLEIHPSTVGRRIDKALSQLKHTMGGFEPAKLHGLRPPQHTSKGVLATLATVAALSAAEKAALAAVAAPLPVLSISSAAAPGWQAGVAGRMLKTFSQGGQNSHGLWFGCAAVALLASLIVFAQNSKNDATGISPTRVSGIPTAGISKLQTRQPRGSTPKRHNISSNSQVGVTARSATILGYLPVTTTQTAMLNGYVVTEGGNPISGAAVTAWASTTNETVKTGNGGSFTFKALEEGTVRLTAKAEGFAPTAWGEYTVLLPLPGLDDPLTIQLEDPVKMTGQVIDETGQPLPGAKVTVVKQFDRQKQIFNGAHDSLTHGSYGRGQLLPLEAVMADSNGRFELAGLKPGYVSLHVQHPARPDIIAEELEADADNAVVVLDRGVAVEGRVLDGLIPMASVQVEIRNGVEGFTGIEGDGASAVTDENGIFVVPGLQILRSDLAVWSFRASAETSSSIKIPKYLFSISRGEGTCTLEMNSADAGKEDPTYGSIDVRRFYGSRTQPDQFGKSRLVVSVNLPEDVADDVLVKLSSPVLFDEQPVVNGTAVFEELPAGAYDVNCRLKRDERNYQFILVPQVVEVREGELHTAELKTGMCTVKGKVLDSNGEAIKGSVRIFTTEKTSPFYGTRFNSGHIASKKLAVSGEFEFRGLVPGTYHLAYSSAGAHGLQTVQCRAGEVSYCEIYPATQLQVTGKIRRSDDKPVGGVRVAFESPVDSLGKSKRAATAETDNRGNFKASLSTGTYTMLVQPREKIYPVTFEVAVDETNTTIPAVTLNQQPPSGIIVKQTGVGAALWWTARFSLVRKLPDGNPIAVTSIYPVSRTHDSVTLSGIEPGEYGLVVSSSVLDDWPQHRDFGESEPFSSVSVPSVQVADEAFAVVSLPLEAGRTVSLSCYPGEQQWGWVEPAFWIKDSAGVKMFLAPERFDLAYRLGLAPGRYKYGVTLDSGEEQSVDFHVLASERHLEVVLQLK